MTFFFVIVPILVHFTGGNVLSLGVSGIIESCATMVDSPSVQRQLTQCPIAKGEGWRRFAVSKLQKDADII